MKALFLKDLTQLFASPLAWVLLAVNQFVLAWIFLVQLDRFQALQGHLNSGLEQAVIAPLFLNAAIVALFVVPLLAMQGFATERRSGALDLLLSAPASPAGLVFGRLTALLGWLTPSALLCLAMAASLGLGARLDGALLGAGLLALWLCLLLYAALSLAFSTLGAQPAGAAATSIGALLLLWLIGDGANAGGLLSWLGIEGHFSRLASGWLSLGDVGYFVLLASAALAVAIFQLHRLRES